jgi:cytoskeletal protein CcmA (bactofilin family)
MNDEPVVEEVQEIALEEVGQEEGTPKKFSTGKKVGLGCGCGCLVVILLVAGLGYWLYRTMDDFQSRFTEQGYKLVLVESMVISADDVVHGPVLYFCTEITINGTIEGDVAALCEHLTINGTINGNLDLLFGAVTISETGVVTGNITAKLVRKLTVDGTVEGEITGTIPVRE